nr:hypothetical protein [Bifidobacterium biavatii]
MSSVELAVGDEEGVGVAVAFVIDVAAEQGEAFDGALGERLGERVEIEPADVAVGL